jgi:hypothetical protein
LKSDMVYAPQWIEIELKKKDFKIPRDNQYPSFAEGLIGVKCKHYQYCSYIVARRRTDIAMA